MNSNEILAAAKAAQPKVRIEAYREAVEELRNKGYTWREVAEFLTQRGVPTDHTRVYRTFARTPKAKPGESRSVEIQRITFLGEKLTKRKKVWHVFDIELPSKLGSPITVVGYVWGSATPRYVLSKEETVTYRNATLVIKSGTSFPMAYITADFLEEGDAWLTHEVYIVPKWEVLV